MVKGQVRFNERESRKRGGLGRRKGLIIGHRFIDHASRPTYFFSRHMSGNTSRPLPPNRCRACLPMAPLRVRHRRQTTRRLGRRRYISRTSAAQTTVTIHTKGQRPRPTWLLSHSIFNLTRLRPTDRPLASRLLPLHRTAYPTLPHAHSFDPPWTRLIKRSCLTGSDYPLPTNVSIPSDRSSS